MQDAVCNASELTGDVALTREQYAAYMGYHTQRNQENTLASAHIKTFPGIRPQPGSTVLTCVISQGTTPSRVSTVEFFACIAAELAPKLRSRPITIVDIGAGGGGQADPFEANGLGGRYIAIDISRSPRWIDGPRGSFTRELIVSDINAFDVSQLPPIDLLVSNTALEHIRDDAQAITALRTRLKPDGYQVHFVPGEASLPLYGPHGYRQYSPRCLDALFPGAKIYRYGGTATNALHKQWITPATRTGNCPLYQNQQEYCRLRTMALAEDQRTGNMPASMYGVVCSQ
jgi:SAM-dependent methyltransferase